MILQAPYLQFLQTLLCEHPSRPFVLLEVRHVSMCLHFTSHSTDAIALAVQQILNRQASLLWNCGRLPFNSL
jgi:hypothetical protein